MSDNEIKQETYVTHEGMGEAIQEWGEEIGLDKVDPETRAVLIGVFRDGWSLCLHKTMQPARDLSIMLLQMAALSRKQGDEFKVVMGGQALETIEALCHQIVGQPEGWQLDDVVEMVRVDSPEEFEEMIRKKEDSDG